MERQRILFSCVGTTDPVRGQHDSGLLHIARHYRPGKIRLFLSAEMEKNIPLYERVFAFMRERWDYAPEVEMVKSGIEDPSDLDALDEPMRAAFEAFAESCPGAEILLNLSSGTPQMEIILSQLALTTRYSVAGVQVKTPERKAGTTKRTNREDYDIEAELENNQDELPGARNRCVTPRLFPIRRERTWRELRALLERGDYDAALDRAGDCLPPALTGIAAHLRARDLLRDDEARTIAARLPPELDLYLGPASSEYWANVDYWLMMKNLLRARRDSDFLLRLSVLTLYLEEAYLRARLDYDALTRSRPDYAGDRVLSMDALQQYDPALYEKFREAVRKETNSEPRDDRSVFLYTRLLRAMSTPKRLMKFFNVCDNLSGQRNHLAHRLHAVSRDDFEKAVNMSAGTFITEMERTIRAIYPDCDPNAFTLHERCLDYIERHR